MIYLHPIFQLLAICFGFYALFLGINRIKSLHFQKPVPFLWKRHVLVGSIALIAMLLGTLGGSIILFLLWGKVFVAGTHAKVGLVILFLLIVGLISGYILHFHKKKRKFLPLLHAANNLLILLLALWQIKTGWDLLAIF